jgi:hypothetical protein
MARIGCYLYQIQKYGKENQMKISTLVDVSRLKEKEEGGAASDKGEMDSANELTSSRFCAKCNIKRCSIKDHLLDPLARTNSFKAIKKVYIFLQYMKT